MWGKFMDVVQGMLPAACQGQQAALGLVRAELLLPSPLLHILTLRVVVMIAMEIISICFTALRCCVLHCLDGKLLDWFWRVAVHAQILADFFSVVESRRFTAWF